VSIDSEGAQPEPGLDPETLEAFRNVRDVHHCFRRGLFVVEGPHAVASLLDSGFELYAALVEERSVLRHKALLARVPEGIPIHSAPREELRGQVGFRFHRGIMAAAYRPKLPSADELIAGLPAGPLRLVVLEGLTDGDNVGAVMRSAVAFGAHALLADKQCCDPLHRRSTRASQCMALKLPFARFSDREALAEAMRAADIQSLALTPDPAAASLDEYARAPASRLALWLGTEGTGLSDNARRAAGTELRIPMAGGCESLNVAATSAVALWALRVPDGKPGNRNLEDF
jgi:tRNA G18 (ribose-2'-O)-methylase SpoU